MLPADGLTMYHATPARCGPASGLSAVSSAPHSLPLAYITCCMRVSFESGREMTSVPLFARLKELVPGDCAGQSVKPGCVEPASLGAFTMPEVSMWVTITLAAPAASWAFENA